MNLFSTKLTPTIANNERDARRSCRPALFVAGATLFFFAVAAYAADTRKDAKLEIAPGGSVTVVNNGGSVTLRSSAGHQVVVSYVTHSDKVEVDQNATADKQRIELRAHSMAGQKPTA